MAVLPALIASEVFEVVPPTNNKTKNGSEKVELTLFDDFLAITGKLDVNSGTKKLLYPPTPLSHIKIQQPFTEGDEIYTIKLSPYKMVLVKPCHIDSGAKFMEMIKSMQKKGVVKSTSSLHSSPVKKVKTAATTSVGYKLSLDGSSTLTKVQDFREEEYVAGPKLFSELCRPHHFTKGEWTKLSRCTMEIIVVEGTAVIHLYAEDSKVVLCRGVINSITTLIQTSESRVKAYFSDYEGVGQIYLFQVTSFKQLKAFMDIVEEYRADYIYNLYTRYRPDILPDCSAPIWDKTCTSMKITHLLTNSSCSIAIGASGRENYGGVNMYIASLSIGDDVVCRRMIVRSIWNPLVVLMDFDLANVIFSIRGNDKLITVRVYYGDDNSMDYEFTSGPEKASTCDIVEEAKLKSLEYAVAQAEKEEKEKALQEIAMVVVSLII